MSFTSNTVIQSLYADLEQDRSLMAEVIIVHALQFVLSHCSATEKKLLKDVINGSQRDQLLIMLESLLKKYLSK